MAAFPSLLCGALLAASGFAAASGLADEAVAPPYPLRVEYDFGWSGIRAAKGAIELRERGGRIEAAGQGRTVGIARALWSLDAIVESELDAGTLAPRRSRLVEKYPRKTLDTVVEFHPDRATALRRESPPPEQPPKPKKHQLPGIRDLVGALLLVRDQPLREGDRLEFHVLPGTSLYLAKVEVIRRESVRVEAGRYPAIRLALDLKRVKGDGTLEPHGKFKRATGWISDDRARVPLRVEADIFIGKVYAEARRIQAGEE